MFIRRLSPHCSGLIGAVVVVDALLLLGVVLVGLVEAYLLEHADEQIVHLVVDGHGRLDKLAAVADGVASTLYIYFIMC